MAKQKVDPKNPLNLKGVAKMANNGVPCHTDEECDGIVLPTSRDHYTKLYRTDAGSVIIDRKSSLDGQPLFVARFWDAVLAGYHDVHTDANGDCNDVELIANDYVLFPELLHVKVDGKPATHARLWVSEDDKIHSIFVIK